MSGNCAALKSSVVFTDCLLPLSTPDVGPSPNVLADDGTQLTVPGGMLPGLICEFEWEAAE